MATMCSCLQYFGHIAIGVTNLDDHKIIADIVRIFSYFSFEVFLIFDIFMLLLVGYP